MNTPIRSAILFICQLLIFGITPHIASASEEDIRDPRFSPDGKHLIFDRCAPERFVEGCRIHVYNLESKTLGYYLPPSGQTWMQANYSYKGDRLTFVTKPMQDRSKSLYSQREDIFLKAQIAVMNTDGSGMQILTDNPSYKGMPAFSHSGDKIIFVQTERLRNTGKTVAAYWDLWELDVGTRKMVLFADKNGFYQMGLPEYFPDDQHVLLNGDAPFLSLLSGTHETFSTRLDDYMKRYKANTVFKVKRGSSLEPPAFTEFGNTRSGCLDGIGNIYFGATFLEEGFRIRRLGADGSRSDWKYPPLQSNSMSELGMNVAHDGHFVAMSIKDGAKNRFMLLDTTTSIWQELILPTEASQINTQNMRDQ